MPKSCVPCTANNDDLTSEENPRKYYWKLQSVEFISWAFFYIDIVYLLQSMHCILNQLSVAKNYDQSHNIPISCCSSFALPITHLYLITDSIGLNQMRITHGTMHYFPGLPLYIPRQNFQNFPYQCLYHNWIRTMGTRVSLEEVIVVYINNDPDASCRMASYKINIK